MTQTATSAKGHAVMVYWDVLFDKRDPALADRDHAKLIIDGCAEGWFKTGAAARAKAAEFTEDPYLKWETRP